MVFLVTGGAGFIGSSLSERLIGMGNEVVCLDNFNDYYDPGLKRRNIRLLLESPGFHLVEGDILDWKCLQDLFDSRSFGCVVHLAARAGVRPSIQDPRLYQRTNVEGTTNLLELAAQKKVPKFILASSSSVYGNNEKVPFSEEDTVDFPISPYAATKKACELMGHTYHVLYGMPVTCLRFFTVYGPRQRPDMAIHKFTEAIVRGKELPVYGDGSTRRDYTYITDILQGIVSSIERCSGFSIYNLGESQTISLSDLIAVLEKSLGKKAKIRRLPQQQGDVRITYADIGKAQRELDYRPAVPVSEGIPRFVSWYLREIEKGD